MEKTARPAITLYGTTWCYSVRQARKMLEEHNLPYEWIDIDQDDAARNFVEETNQGFRSVPTILFPDGSLLVEPSDHDLRAKLERIK